MSLVRSLARRASQHNLLPNYGRHQHTTLRAGPAACRRPSASTDCGGGGRAPPRTPLIAEASVVAVLPIVPVVLGVFCQPRRVAGEEGGGVLFVGPLPLPPVSRRT